MCRVCKHELLTIPSGFVIQAASHEIKIYSTCTNALHWFHIAFTLVECPLESSPLSSAPLSGYKLWMCVDLTVSTRPIT